MKAWSLRENKTGENVTIIGSSIALAYPCIEI